MKYQFHTVNFAPFLGGTAPLDEVLEAAAAAGFRSVAIDQFSIDRFLEHFSMTRLRSLLDSLGLECDEAGGLVFGPDPDLDAVNSGRVLEVASVLGNQMCGAQVTVQVDAGLVQRVRRHLDVLAAGDVRIAFEFTPYCALGSLHQARWLCAELGLEAAGLMLDPWHLFIGHEGVESLRDLRAEEIATVQFDDAAPLASADLASETRRRVMPGKGTFDLEGFARAVMRTGYDGPVALEVLNPVVASGDPAPFAQDAMSCLQHYWGPPSLLA